MPTGFSHIRSVVSFGNITFLQFTAFPDQSPVTQKSPETVSYSRATDPIFRDPEFLDPVLFFEHRIASAYHKQT